MVSHSLLSAFPSCSFSFLSFLIWTSSLRMVADVAAVECWSLSVGLGWVRLKPLPNFHGIRLKSKAHWALSSGQPMVSENPSLGKAWAGVRWP